MKCKWLPGFLFLWTKYTWDGSFLVIKERYDSIWLIQSQWCWDMLTLVPSLGGENPLHAAEVAIPTALLGHDPVSQETFLEPAIPPLTFLCLICTHKQRRLLAEQQNAPSALESDAFGFKSPFCHLLASHVSSLSLDCYTSKNQDKSSNLRRLQSRQDQVRWDHTCRALVLIISEA